MSGVMEHAYFESLARNKRCDYCADRRQATTLAPGVNAIYCISLQEQPHRTTKAAAQFQNPRQAMQQSVAAQNAALSPVQPPPTIPGAGSANGSSPMAGAEEMPFD